MKTHDGFNVQIEGHTDYIGSYEYNKRLSEKRANAVKQYLIKLGVDPDRLITVGYGKSRPLYIFRNALNRVVTFGKTPFGANLKVKNQNKKKIQSLLHNPEILFIHNIESNYYIQLGAFSSLKNAQKLAGKLRAVLPDKTILVKEKSFYKVRVGYVHSREQALKLIPVIKSSGALNPE